MKKTLISLAAASLVASSAFAADKGIDIVVGGQATVYYQTWDVDGANTSLFDQDSAAANVGVQLNLGADLGNNFTFGSQLTYLGTAGLEKTLVGGVMQGAYGSSLDATTTNDIALTKLFIAKQIANTTVKIGRQELPMSLSPLAYSEGWNVYKNTFDAIVVINADIPKTTLVGAYVTGVTGINDVSTIGDLGGGAIAGEAYMLTASTTAIPMTTLTGSYYALKHVLGTGGVHPTGGVDTDAFWIDAAIASKDLPMGLNFGLQYANLDVDVAGAKDTTMYGAKVGITPIEALTLGLAYNDVDDGALALLNTGTGTESALFTNIVANDQAVALDGKTWMASVSYNTGAYGTIGLAYADTSADLVNLNGANNDMAEFDLTYSVQAGGVDYLVAYVNQDYDTANSDTDIIRIVARYNF